MVGSKTFADRLVVVVETHGANWLVAICHHVRDAVVYLGGAPKCPKRNFMGRCGCNRTGPGSARHWQPKSAMALGVEKEGSLWTRERKNHESI